MIYIDSSVALAHLLAEDRKPPTRIWDEDLVASRLLEYEVWNRVHDRDLTRSHGDAVRLVMARIGFLELAQPVLARALQPFPLPVRTLDALHLASASFLRESGAELSIATYDARMREAARSMGLTLWSL